jgi:hypothetical protein
MNCLSTGIALDHSKNAGASSPASGIVASQYAPGQLTAKFVKIATDSLQADPTIVPKRHRGIPVNISIYPFDIRFFQNLKRVFDHERPLSIIYPGCTYSLADGQPISAQKSLSTRFPLTASQAP